jgi:ABC-type transporter Mla MlaB component
VTHSGSSWKITVQEEAEVVTLQLEGRATGTWVPEINRAWQQIDSSLGSRKLRVDLNGVTHMDRDAKALLAEIHRVTGAEFLANTPLTKYFAEEARRKDGKP